MREHERRWALYHVGYPPKIWYNSPPSGLSSLRNWGYDVAPSKATGNSRSGIPGNHVPQNSRREFPGIYEILAGITGNL